MEVTPVKEVRQDIPDGLLVCMAQPAEPDGMILGQKDGLIMLDDEVAAKWIGGVIIAGRDCRAKLYAVRRLIQQ